MIPKTASALTPADIDLFSANLKTRQLTMDQQMQQRLQAAHLVARRAAKLLKEQFAAKSVVLFGSVVTPGLFHSRSDIDLAVWGIQESEYYRVVGLLQSLDSRFPIDLILFEEASTSLQQTIRKEGMEI